MAMIDALLAELSHEASNSRKMLERVPEEHLAWKPHDKSMTLSRLTGHIAEIPGWGAVILGEDDFDMAAVSDFTPAQPESQQELLEVFDKNIDGFQKAAEGRTDEEMMAPWRLKNGETVLVELPRVAAVRGFVLSHITHHRGQLSVYMRLLDAPVPATYGPSADDQGEGW
jgi:uncharacterized damage-inducible protein DinB